MDADFVRLLEDEAAFDKAWFASSIPCIFDVDWGEEDDNIVNLCGDALGLPDLHADWHGEKLAIRYGEKELIAPLTMDVADRDITVRSLNTILAPDYEIRFVVLSQGSDTASFCALSAKDWSELERTNEKAVRDLFLPLDSLPNIFTEMTDVHLPKPAADRLWKV